MLYKYQRPIVAVIARRVAEPSPQLLIISGPRQVGKTSAILQVVEKISQSGWHFNAADKPTEANPFELRTVRQAEEKAPALFTSLWLVEQWRAARRRAVQWKAEQEQRARAERTSHGAKPYILVFDEVHLILAWAETVKGLWDEDRRNDFPMHVVLLGSAPLLIHKGVSESLAGRFEQIAMSHWSYAEMRDCFDFSLDEYIYFGGYPGSARYIQDQERWANFIRASLIETNLTKDIMALARIEKPALLRQLFQLACSYSGQIVALQTLQASLEDAGNVTTLANYLHLLRQTGLIAGLQPYITRPVKQRKSPPKLNVLNTCFLAVNSGMRFETARAQHASWGHIVESCVGAHLLNSASALTEVFYWRVSPDEVDFILVRNQRICAIEVKSGPPKSNPMRGLRKFKELHPNARIQEILIGEDGWALDEALQTPADDWFST